jgi:hypothetical protein
MTPIRVSLPHTIKVRGCDSDQVCQPKRTPSRDRRCLPANGGWEEVDGGLEGKLEENVRWLPLLLVHSLSSPGFSP